MSEVIFARPRHEYDSYRDLYTLIEVSGYRLIYADEIDPQSDNLYIVTLLNGETQNGWQDARAEIILWDLEWRVDAPPRVPGVRRVWASDAWYAEQIGAEYVPMGSHPRLAGAEPVNRQCIDYDVAALMYTGPYRRNTLINQLRAGGVRVAAPAWGKERDTRLRRSRAMLHIHQHDNVPTVAPLRWALAAAYELPIISERVENDGGVAGVVCADYERLVGQVQHMMRLPITLQMMGEMLHNELCEDFRFRDRVEAAV